MINSARILKKLQSFQKRGFIPKKISNFPSLARFSTSEDRNDYQEYMDFYITKKTSIQNLSDYIKCSLALQNLLVHESHKLEDTKYYLLDTIHSFPKEQQLIYSKDDIIRLSEIFVAILQKNVEIIDPEIIVTLSEKFCLYDAKFVKGFWHFVEFLLTRTPFLSIFKESHILRLLNSYYFIESNLERDKYQYILDKIENHIASNTFQFNEDELTQILFIYNKSKLGSSLLYQKLFDRFEQMKLDMKIEKFITCAWSFVSYNYDKKNKNMKIFYPEIYDRVLKNMSQLNSYNLKQFLWAYHKEQEIL